MRNRSWSVSALTSSAYCVFASITQIRASRTSLIWLLVRSMMPTKIELWWDIRKVENAMAKIRPRYLARSPVNICQATKFIPAPPPIELRLLDDHCSYWRQKKLLLVTPYSFDQNVHHPLHQPRMLDERESRFGDQQR